MSYRTSLVGKLILACPPAEVRYRRCSGCGCVIASLASAVDVDRCWLCMTALATATEMARCPATHGERQCVLCRGRNFVEAL